MKASIKNLEMGVQRLYVVAWAIAVLACAGVVALQGLEYRQANEAFQSACPSFKEVAIGQSVGPNYLECLNLKSATADQARHFHTAAISLPFVLLLPWIFMWVWRWVYRGFVPKTV